MLPDARSTLERTSENLAKILEKISKKERGINVNMNELGTEYKAKAEDLKTIVNRYNELNNIVKEYREKYKEITDKYESVTAKITDQGNEVTKSSPVAHIKKAIENLKTEMKNMDLRIGVLSHTVMQHKFKERKGDQTDYSNVPVIDELVA
mmetsp:Transcript_137967/g.195244  ORF Transcript_137967/g.195244 Transcript_137967/m.195244 type:complete len:151 (+) Transcript_137967:48-500(+)